MKRRIGSDTAAAAAMREKSWIPLPDDSDFPPLGPPSRQQSLDLRHSDSDIRQSTPPVPPGFESQSKQTSPSRHSTPTVPPGLGKPPSAVPLDLDAGSRPSSRPASRASLKRISSAQIQPALPLKPVAPSRTGTPTPAKAVPRNVEGEVETPTKPSKAVEKPEAAAESQGAKEAAVATPAKAGPADVQPAANAQATIEIDEVKVVPFTPTKPESSKQDTQRRKAPGKLDIAAATKKKTADASSSTPAESDSQTKDAAAVAQTPITTSQPATPSLSSPAVKAAPKTLRVVQTPKAETPPGATVSTPKEQVQTQQTAPTTTAATTTKLPSRQPSVASINLPVTPSSEQVSISDNISVTSTSQSRANSPPPAPGGKVGSAPVRGKTKSQLKKERQERAKVLEAEKVEDTASKAVEEEQTEAQEAIVSRKKKAKKEREPKGKGKAAVPIEPKAPEMATEGSKDVEVEEPSPVKPKEEPSKPASANRSRAATLEEPQPPPAAEASASVKPTAPSPTKAPKAKPPRSPPAQPAPRPSPHEPSPPPTPTLTQAQLLAEIKATEPAIQKCLDSLFRSPAGAHYKTTQPIAPKDLTNTAMWERDVELNLTKTEVEALLRGTSPSLHYGGHGGRIWDRGMVTSTGAHLRALTKELEARFLELEKMLKEMPQQSKWKPAKPQNEMRFPSIDLEALKRGFEEKSCGRGLSVMEQMVQDGSATKKGAFLVDEASKYINEFVMPPATPPPSAGGSVGAAGAGSYAVPGVGGGAVRKEPDLPMPSVSVDIAERQLNEAKRVAEERDQALKKAIKKNKKILGLG